MGQSFLGGPCSDQRVGSKYLEAWGVRVQIRFLQWLAEPEPQIDLSQMFPATPKLCCEAAHRSHTAYHYHVEDSLRFVFVRGFGQGPICS